MISGVVRTMKLFFLEGGGASKNITGNDNEIEHIMISLLPNCFSISMDVENREDGGTCPLVDGKSGGVLDVPFPPFLLPTRPSIR